MYFPIAKTDCETGVSTVHVKRMCDHMVYEPDSLFLQNVAYIKSKVIDMNHSTRYWLAFKFLRPNKNDFETNAVLKLPYSHERICALLGINYFTIRKFVLKCGKTRKLRDVLGRVFV